MLKILWEGVSKIRENKTPAGGGGFCGLSGNRALPGGKGGEKKEDKGDGTESGAGVAKGTHGNATEACES